LNELSNEPKYPKLQYVLSVMHSLFAPKEIIVSLFSWQPLCSVKIWRELHFELPSVGSKWLPITCINRQGIHL